MGQDKARLRLPGGETLLQRALGLLCALPPGAGLEFLPPQISGAGCGGIADCGASRGPLSGLQAIAARLQRERPDCTALLAVPVDMPLLQPVQLAQLCTAAVASNAAALCFGRHWLPLWLRLDSASRAYLDEVATGAGDASLRALMAGLGGAQLPPPPGDWHCNVNRPHEFKRAIERIATGENAHKRETNHGTAE